MTFSSALFVSVPLGNTATTSAQSDIGTIPATLNDFKIEPPSLLTIPIKNDIPVQVDMTWRKE